MSAASIQDALDTQLQTLPNLTAVAWPGVSYTPIVGTPYMAPAVAGLNSIPAAAGADGVIRWTGVYRVNVMWSSTSVEGTAAAYALAETVRALFKRGLNLVTTDGWKIIVQNTTIAAPVVKMPWISITVSVSFWADEYP